jgi:hypothetical protein
MLLQSLNGLHARSEYSDNCTKLKYHRHTHLKENKLLCIVSSFTFTSTLKILSEQSYKRDVAINNNKVGLNSLPVCYFDVELTIAIILSKLKWQTIIIFRF